MSISSYLPTFYIIITFTLFSITFLQSYNFHQQYFSSVIIYLDNPSTNFILYNVVVASTMLLYKIIIKIFFIEVKQNETLKIVQKLKGKVIDLIFFIYITHAQLHFQMFTSIALIILMFILHNNVIFRSQYLVHTPALTTLSLNYRLLGFMLILLFIDFQILLNCISWLGSQDGVAAMSIYYLLTISMSLIEPTIRYFIDFYEKYTYQNIPNIDQNLVLIGAIINIPKFIIQILLSLWIAKKFGFVFFFILTAIQLISELSTTVKAYRNMKKLTDTMKNLKRVNQQTLKDMHDTICMICFHQMQSAILLPCKHAFHQQCLRQWIIKNSNHFCPKCKNSFNFDRQRQPQQRNQVRIQPDQNNAFDVLQGLQRRRNILKQGLQRQQLQKSKKQLQQQQQQQSKYQKQSIDNKKYIQKIQYKQVQYKKNNFQQGQRYQSDSCYSQINNSHNYNSQLNKTKNRVGSLPYCLPTEAVYKRKLDDLIWREIYLQRNQKFLKILKCSPIEQLLKISD